jgi:hypothetical protein
MPGVAPKIPPATADVETEIGGISLSDLVQRLGEAPATVLFARIDRQLRRGDRIYGTTVRAGRESFSAALAPGRAQLVIPGRATGPKAGHTAKSMEGMVMISLSDLEAVVKASQPDFDWTVEFAPRPDLPVATTPVVVRSGTPGRRMLTP